MRHPGKIVVAAAGLALVVTGGCGDTNEAEEKTGDSGVSTSMPTFNRDIAPIIRDNCVSCHQEGAIAPFALDSYEAVESVGAAIKTATAERTMPPMNLDNSGECRTYQDAPWLEDEEIAAIGEWVDAGMPEGDGQSPDMEVTLPRLEEPYETIDIGVDYSPDPELEDDYRCFVVDAPLEETRYLTAYEFIPGNRETVHHAIVFLPQSEAAAQAAIDKEEAEDGPGYTCFGDAGVDADFVAGWAPGVLTSHMPEGTGVEIPGGRKLIIQMHYNTINGTAPDRTEARLRLEETVDEPAFIIPFVPVDSLDAEDGEPEFHLELPPGMESASGRMEATMSEYSSAFGEVPPPALDIYSVGPHMHLAGRTLDMWVERENGESECLARVEAWDFDWQQSYDYADGPIRIDGEDDVLKLECTYDTTDREETTYWGDGSRDEMCVGFIYATVPDDA